MNTRPAMTSIKRSPLRLAMEVMGFIRTYFARLGR
jgi:hypothetical protein